MGEKNSKSSEYASVCFACLTCREFAWFWRFLAVVKQHGALSHDWASSSQQVALYTIPSNSWRQAGIWKRNIENICRRELCAMKQVFQVHIHASIMLVIAKRQSLCYALPCWGRPCVVQPSVLRSGRAAAVGWVGPWGGGLEQDGPPPDPVPRSPVASSGCAIYPAHPTRAGEHTVSSF